MNIVQATTAIKPYINYRFEQNKTLKMDQFTLKTVTVSVGEFRKNLELQKKQTFPKDRINWVFYLRFAENSIDNICGRYVWARFDAEYHNYFSENRCVLNDTICEITRDALLGAVFGVENRRTLEYLSFEEKEPEAFTHAWQCIEDNVQNLASDYSFYAYSFSMTAAGQFNGHAFMVIQYLDENNETAYRVYQSFVKEYTLSTSLREHFNYYTHSQFEKFFKDLNKCVTETVWTEDLERFYTRSFNLKKGFIVGQRNPCCQCDFAIEWGKGSLDEFFKHEQEFVEYLSSEYYPEINVK